MPEIEDYKKERENNKSLPPLAGFGFLNYSVETLMYFILFVIEDNTAMDFNEVIKNIRTFQDFVRILKQTKELAIGDRRVSVFGNKSKQNTILLDDVLAYLDSERNIDNTNHSIERVIDGFLNPTSKKMIRGQLITLPDRPSHYYASTNQSISDLSIKILDEVKDDAVLDVCSAFGSFLCRCVDDDIINQYYGIEISALLCLIARIKFAIMGVECNITCGDIFNTSLGRRFKRIFCDPPFAARLPIDMRHRILMEKDDVVFSMGTSSEWMYIIKALENLDESGKMVAVMPCGTLTNTKDYQMRETLISRGLVESVIDLPSGAMLGSNVGVALVVFSYGNDSIKFVDAKGVGLLPKESRFMPVFDYKEIYTLFKASDDESIEEISCDEVISNESELLPSRYTDVSKLLNRFPNIVRLEDIVEDVYRGYQITAAERSKLRASARKQKSVRVLTVSDISYSNISGGLDRLAPIEKFSKYYLKNGDIVLSAKGDNAKVAVVNMGKNNEPIFPNGSLIVIRLKDGYDPYYLSAYLNSQFGEDALNQVRTGSIIKSINPSSLLKLLIPFPKDDSRQKDVTNKYKMNISMIKSFSERLEEIKNENKSLFDWIVIGRD